jgi:hypothetical protein
MKLKRNTAINQKLALEQVVKFLEAQQQIVENNHVITQVEINVTQRNVLVMRI